MRVAVSSAWRLMCFSWQMPAFSFLFPPETMHQVSKFLYRRPGPLEETLISVAHENESPTQTSVVENTLQTVENLQTGSEAAAEDDSCAVCLEKAADAVMKCHCSIFLRLVRYLCEISDFCSEILFVQILLECGHSGICCDCAGRLWVQRADMVRPCPLCRKNFSGVVKIVSRDESQVLKENTERNTHVCAKALTPLVTFRVFYCSCGALLHSCSFSTWDKLSSGAQVHVEPLYYVYALPPLKPPHESNHRDPAESVPNSSSGSPQLLEFHPGHDWRPLPDAIDTLHDAARTSQQPRSEQSSPAQAAATAEEIDTASFGQVWTIHFGAYR